MCDRLSHVLRLDHLTTSVQLTEAKDNITTLYQGGKLRQVILPNSEKPTPCNSYKTTS